MKDYVKKMPFGVQKTPLSIWKKNAWRKGFQSQDFDTLKHAARHFNDTLRLTDAQMMNKYPKLWTPSRLWKSFKPATTR